MENNFLDPYPGNLRRIVVGPRSINEEMDRMRELAGLGNKKKIYVLVGPPSVGKSTWTEKTFKGKQIFLINRDDIVEKVGKKFGLTYNEMFTPPPRDAKEGDEHPKYGKVVPSMDQISSWQPLSFSLIKDANLRVEELFNDALKTANGQDTIVVDLTNMNAENRKISLKAIEGSEGEYEKVAVVFKFEGIESLIKAVAKKRAEAARAMGREKDIPDVALDRMFASYEPPTEAEGFDKIVHVDNSKNLKDAIG